MPSFTPSFSPVVLLAISSNWIPVPSRFRPPVGSDSKGCVVPSSWAGSEAKGQRDTPSNIFVGLYMDIPPMELFSPDADLIRLGVRVVSLLSAAAI